MPESVQIINRFPQANTTTIPDHVTRVLKKMFYDYESVVISRELMTGFSDSRAIIVRPVKSRGAEHVFVVKVAPANLIKLEWETYLNYMPKEQGHLAKVVGEPVYLPNTDYGGLRYQLSDFFGFESSIPQNYVEPFSKIYIEIPLPGLLAIDQYLNEIAEIISAIDYIYSILAILAYAEKEDLARFWLDLRGESSSTVISQKILHPLLESAKLEPLRVISSKYGSPASFDLLGVGKILEVIKESLKDILWRGSYEKRQAGLKEEKAQLENDKLRLEVATAMLNLVKEGRELKLTDTETKLLVEPIASKLSMLPAYLIVQDGSDSEKKND